jgi:anaerobic magnesium-protoporphyrin IX monomethyl ester cyclase
MTILLLSMPDSFEHTASVTMRMPNGALASLAGNVDRHHRVAVADLVLVQRSVRETIERLMVELEPDIVGLSIMTFQRKTASKIVSLLRTLRPALRIVVGGYDPSLASDVYEQQFDVDAIVRGEGDLTFRELVRAWEAGREPSDVKGLSYRTAAGFVRTAPRPASRLNGDDVRPPLRAARVLLGYTFIGRQIDVVETSRGCTYDCSFCSIIEMRGRNFYRWPIERIIADIVDAHRRGARAIFIVDDNITLDVARFESLCRAIVDAGLHRIDYIVQAMTSSIASHGETLAPLMRKAGFRYVFLGIENVLDADLQFLRARAKNLQRGTGGQGNATEAAIDVLHRNGMYVVGGLIVGNPSDTREAIEANLAFARRYIDWPYIQHPTPYPGTPMTIDFRSRGLIVNEDVSAYDGTTAVVRSEHLSAEEIEFLRWRAERWMKLGHFWPTLRHSPWFVLRHGAAMLMHTFRGSTLRSLIGLESDRAVFARYREMRRVEREYLPSIPDSPATIAASLAAPLA